MPDEEIHYEPRPLIERVPGFSELYADSGYPDGPEAPGLATHKKFKQGGQEFDREGIDLLRDYDRQRSGGINAATGR